MLSLIIDHFISIPNRSGIVFQPVRCRHHLQPAWKLDGFEKLVAVTAVDDVHLRIEGDGSFSVFRVLRVLAVAQPLNDVESLLEVRTRFKIVLLGHFLLLHDYLSVHHFDKRHQRELL